MTDYRQCTTIGTFHSNTTEFLYFLFVMTMSLILPLIIMIGSYLTIVWVICRRSKKEHENNLGSNSTFVISRAKIKSVRVMGVLVMGFVLCWSPYYTMSLWWWIDQDTMG